MERDARLAFYFIKTNSSKSQTRILVLHNAMKQAVWGSTERHEGMMVQEIHAVRKIDTKGTRRKSGSRVAQLDPKHMWRQEDRENMCCMRIKLLLEQHKEKNIPEMPDEFGNLIKKSPL